MEYKQGYLVCKYCGMIMYYFKKIPLEGSWLRSEDVLLPDNTNPISGTHMMCYYCGEYPAAFSPEDIKEL